MTTFRQFLTENVATDVPVFRRLEKQQQLSVKKLLKLKSNK